ncbi:PH domain-containing protein [Glycomyces sp. NRRL B-16210]|uniref:PH domain-containing protein n=1 Tax=Glycomyces sp. NRRL B-16210 TaxID=1463821 RepID=UPI0010E1A21F|nr:PH domain-containing protein [Glycomyces sp. NRRL B-16210]
MSGDRPEDAAPEDGTHATPPQWEEPATVAEGAFEGPGENGAAAADHVQFQQEAPPTGTVRQRLHPLTPLLESFRFFIAAAAAAGINVFTTGNFLFAVYISVFAAVAGGIASLIAIQYRGFVIWGRELHIYAGVFTRSHRTVPLDRLQSVDLVRPIRARLFGLAQLNIEVAGGDGTDARLAYLKVDRALALRAELLAIAGRPVAPEAPAADEALPEGAEPAATGAALDEVVPTVTARRLAFASLLEALPVQVTALAVIGSAFAISGAIFGFGNVVTTVWVGFFAPALLGYLQSTISTVNKFLRNCRFRLSRDGGNLLVERGLTDTSHGTVPVDRVTAVSFDEPVLWRSRGWRRVQVWTAAVAQQGGSGTSESTMLLPVGGAELVARVAVEAVPELDVASTLDPEAVARPPRRARWRMPLRWKRTGAALQERAFVVRGGLLVNTYTAVPYARIQAVDVVQGRVQRMQGLATVRAMTAGNLWHDAVAAHRDVREAVAMAAELRERADAAAALERPRLS